MPDQIKVLNYHTDNVIGALCIMQSKGATLGNPYYKMAKTPQGRFQAIRRFRRYLWENVQIAGSPIRSEILRLAREYNDGKEIRLYCCCSPKPCHGDVIADCIRWMAGLVTPKPHDQRVFDCKKCGHTGVPNLIESNIHTKLVCQKCDSYIKFASKKELEAITGVKQ